MLSLESSTSQIRSALNLLPSISPDSVTVTSEDVSGGKTYRVTLNSDRGDWDDLELRDSSSSSSSGTGVSMSVREITKGKPSGETWTLGFDGQLSGKLDHDISAKQV